MLLARSRRKNRIITRCASLPGMAKKLAATVYQPELQAGENAPLIIATHGFGGFRAKRPMSIYEIGRASCRERV